MPPQARLGDKAFVPADAHGCPACPHTATGPAIGGSPNVFVNGRPAIRVDDPGIHAACCGPNTWNAKTGSSSVFINGRAAHRLGDMVKHCGGMGSTIEGSANVFVGGPPPRGENSDAPNEHIQKGVAILRIIREADGQPIAGLTLVVRAPDGMKSRHQTDSNGEVHIPEIKGQSYVLEEVLEKDERKTLVNIFIEGID